MLNSNDELINVMNDISKKLEAIIGCLEIFLVLNFPNNPEVKETLKKMNNKM